jgi:hypothetical protein
MRTIKDTIDALEHTNSRLAALDPSQASEWAEVLGGRQQLIEFLLFLLDASGQPMSPEQAKRVSDIWMAADALAERLRVHRALLRQQLAEVHRSRFLCQALTAAPLAPTYDCKG